MNLPFTVDQFFSVFENYNLFVWPTQIVLNLLALIAVFFVFKPFKFKNKIITGTLGFFWIWIGIFYHLLFFTSINKASYVFGFLFIVQGVLFFYSGILKQNISFSFNVNFYSVVGIIFIVYALFVYPVLGYGFGHIYPKSPTFGLPCPTTIFTFGLLLLTEKSMPKYILVIPLVWSLIGFSAAANLKVFEDFGLVIAGILGVSLLLIRDKRVSSAKSKNG